MSLRIIKEGKAWSHTNRARDRDNRPRANKVTRLVSLGIESTKGGDELANQEQKPSE